MGIKNGEIQVLEREQALLFEFEDDYRSVHIEIMFITMRSNDDELPGRSMGEMPLGRGSVIPLQ